MPSVDDDLEIGADLTTSLEPELDALCQSVEVLGATIGQALEGADGNLRAALVAQLDGLLMARDTLTELGLAPELARDLTAVLEGRMPARTIFGAIEAAADSARAATFEAGGPATDEELHARLLAVDELRALDAAASLLNYHDDVTRWLQLAGGATPSAEQATLAVIAQAIVDTSLASASITAPAATKTEPNPLLSTQMQDVNAAVAEFFRDGALGWASLTAGVKSEVRAVFEGAQNRVLDADLSPSTQQDILIALEALNSVLDAMIDLQVYLVSITIGVSEGLATMLGGLVQLAAYVADVFLAPIKELALGDNTARQQLHDKNVEMVRALAELGPSFNAWVANWVERFKAAPTEEKAAMTGRFVGQFYAFLATATGFGAVGPGTATELAAERVVVVSGNAAAITNAGTAAAVGTAARVGGPLALMMEAKRPSPPALKEHAVTEMGQVNIRSRVGDMLDGHEVLQHKWLRIHELITGERGVGLSKFNSVIALSEEQHRVVTALQREAKLHRASDLARMTPEQVLEANANILVRAGVPLERVNAVIDDAMEMLAPIRQELARRKPR